MHSILLSGTLSFVKGFGAAMCDQSGVICWDSQGDRDVTQITRCLVKIFLFGENFSL